MSNLFSYNLSGLTNQRIGLDVATWNDVSLSGNSPFITSASTTYPGYSNINSIINWDTYGNSTELRHFKIRTEIKSLYDTNTGTTWSAYTEDEQKVLSKYFIVDKPKRDEVYTQEEQDEFNHYKIYDFISDDAMESMAIFNSKATPKSIDYKKDVRVRFHPEYGFDIYGYLTGVTYYENLNVTINAYGFHVFNFSNPILNYKADYTVGADSYVQSRIITRRWYTMDDELCPEAKTSLKIYEPLTARAEGRRRRHNLINRLLIDTVGLVIISTPSLSGVTDAEADAINFMHDIEGDISAYYESGAKKNTAGDPCTLIQSISAHTYSRLDNLNPYNTGTTIRDYILYRLDP